MTSAEGTGYESTGNLLGWIGGVIAFIWVWIAAVGEAGWVVGIALGWIPAAFAGSLTYALIKLLWPIAAIGLVLAWLAR